MIKGPAWDRRCVDCIAGLQKLRDFQPKKDATKTLLKWIVQNGGYVGPIDLKTGKATATIKFNADVIRVPTSCQVRPSGKQTTVSGQHEELAVFLLGQRSLGKQSFWHPYLRALPRDVHKTSPFFRGSTSHDLDPALMVADTLKWTRKGFASKFKEHQAAGRIDCSFVEYLWIRTSVAARVMQCGKVCVLMPLIDAIHHAPHDPNCMPVLDSGENDKKATHSFHLVCRGRTVLKGEPISIQFGNKCNERLWLTHGKTDASEANDVHNYAVLFLPAPLDETAAKLLGRPRSHDDEMDWYRQAIHFGWETRVSSKNDPQHRYKVKLPDSRQGRDHEAWEAMLAHMRLLVATPEELQALKALPEVPISVRNETATLKLLRDTLEKRNKEFRTSFKADTDALREEKDDWERNMLTVARAEKVAIEFMLTFVHEALAAILAEKPEKMSTIPITAGYFNRQWSKQQQAPPEKERNEANPFDHLADPIRAPPNLLEVANAKF